VTLLNLGPSLYTLLPSADGGSQGAGEA